MATSVDEAIAGARKVEYPVLVRPSYVLGGRAMVIAYDDSEVVRYMTTAIEYSQERPVLIDHFLEDAQEVDVDALCDGKDVVIAGIMQHIEEAGVHSGDSSCVLPAVDLSPEVMETLRAYTRKLALALNVIGLVNLQFAVQRGKVFVIEVNPRASRTVPYVSKATGVQLAKVASRLMTGKTLRELLPEQLASGEDLGTGEHFFVKSPVFPWGKFQGVDPVLGPEMRSTGEVMGVGTTFGEAFAKAQIAAGLFLPTGGTVFFSVNDHDKRQVAALARRVNEQGRSMGMALTSGTVPAAGKPTFELGEDEMEIGIGIHGEPGRRRVKLTPALEITEMLTAPIVEDLGLKAGDQVLAMVNGMGGTPLIELYIVFDALHRILHGKRITIARNLIGNYITSLDMAGTSITLVRLDDELTKYWDAPVHTPALRWGM